MFVKDLDGKFGSTVSNSVGATVNSLGLKLFKSVLKVDDADGYVVKDGFAYPKCAGDVTHTVTEYVFENVITNDKIRKTFLKTWDENSSYWEQMVEHIGGVYSLGYGNIGTYSFPENLIKGIPQGTKLFLVGVLTRELFISKVLGMFASGVAMQQETIEDMLALLEALNYEFTGEEVVLNKEAQLLIADKFGILPREADAFLRYVIYKTTDSTLLIKSNDVIQALNFADVNSVYTYFNRYLTIYGNFNALSKGFNRFKPLFLALKNSKTKSFINKISKLSKVNHTPMKGNSLNELSYRRIDPNDLQKASIYAIFRALNYCNNRLYDFGENRFLTYKIRNGKTKVVEKDSSRFVGNANLKANRTTLLSYCNQYLADKVRGKRIYIPEGVRYALPVSEKQMIGGVPFGTKITSNEKLCAGIYWKNKWGARDFDLSAITPTERISWNSKWKGKLTYSGDVTDAPTGAMEFMMNNDAYDEPVLLLNNRFSGQPDAEYQIVVGKVSDAKVGGSGYILAEDRILFQTPRVKSASKEMIIGAFIPVKKNVFYEYVVFNLRSGSSRVSSSVKGDSLKSILQEYSRCMALNELIIWLGASRAETPEEADVDLSIEKLTATTITELFS